MSMKAEIKASLISSLEAKLDPFMAVHGFRRPARSLVYKREYLGSTQSIDIELQIHPKDNPNAAAAIYPRMAVQVPAVDLILDDMIDGNRGLMEGITAGRSKQPIDFTSEKAALGRWFIFHPYSVLNVVTEIQTFIERWTMPFLDEYATPDDIVRSDEQGDSRMVADRAHLMRVVAAAVVCKRKDYAQALMEKQFGASGARKRYQQVFDYIERTA